VRKIDNIKGLLIDLEGVLYTGDELIKGSIQAIERLNQKFKIRYLTNTTTASRNLIFKKLKKLNFPLVESDIFSPSIAVNAYLKNIKVSRIYLMANSNLKPDFNDFIIDDIQPEAVILGDIYKEFTFDNLNKVFELISNNDCIFIALHKNKYCKRDGKIALDLGPFVNSLEYATSKDAVIIGKPEKEFFDLAVNSLNLNKKEIVMVGDDIISDIGGAKKNKIRAIQVKTGKYQYLDELKKFVQPDLRINSIIDLFNILDN